MKIDGRELDMNYDVQLRGRKSRNPIIRLCDHLCMRINGEMYTTVFSFWLAVSLPSVFLLHCATIKHGIDLSWYMWMAVFIVIQIDDIYRHYRHKYIKRHRLPGPYGWGTLDKNPNHTYINTIK